MSRRRKAAAAILSALMLGAACELAHAQEAAPSEGSEEAPAYTLEVDSDAPDVVSFEALAARLGSDLRGAVARPGGAAPSRAAIVIRYRERELVVRAAHAGGRVLERAVRAEGDGAAVQREAVLLAGNLARDEARELLDALAARPAPPPRVPPEAPAAPAPPAKPRVDEGYHPVTVALFHPLATNYARPNATSNLSVSLIYGRVGLLDGAALGGAVVYASRGVYGLQLGVAATAVNGPLDGAQLGGAGNLVTGPGNGVQIAGGGNLALARFDGAQLGGALNLVEGAGSGAQVAGGANLALARFDGAQLGGAFNLTRGGLSGVQIAGGGNVVTRQVDGAQLGSVNVAGSVDGLQLGVINVARKVDGAQLGAINIAEEVDGAALGVISISKHGIHPIAWTSNLQYMNAGVKFSTKYVFTAVAAHTGTIEGDFDNVGVTGIVGGHIPLPARFDVEVQGAVSHLVPRPSQSAKKGNVWVAPQVIGGYSFARHLRVFAGGGVRLPATVDLGRDVARPEVLAGVQF
ncbi:MAG: hypothetical protein KF894_27215 [Labilithrix sp.]|nr:hypothetical protein [Labilithrix sp.]